MDIFLEQIVTRQRRALYELLFYACWVLLILCALLERPMTVGELSAQVPHITGPALSQHLHRLREGGLVQAEKLGQYVRYAIRDPRLSALMEVLKREYCGD